MFVNFFLIVFRATLCLILVSDEKTLHGTQALALLTACEKQERNLQHIASNMPQCPAVVHEEDCRARDQQRHDSNSASFDRCSSGFDVRNGTTTLHRGSSGQSASANPGVDLGSVRTPE